MQRKGYQGQAGIERQYKPVGELKRQTLTPRRRTKATIAVNVPNQKDLDVFCAPFALYKGALGSHGKGS